VRGPGRLRIARAISDPRRTGRWVEKGPKTEAGKRVIALDQETVQAFLAHRQLVGGGPYDRIFTSPGGSRGRVARRRKVDSTVSSGERVDGTLAAPWS
jgi:hypothetical protein